MTPPLRTFGSLLEEYDGFLFDAYGVLYYQSGAVPHAAELLEELNRRDIPFLIVTNDASKLPSTAAAKFKARQLPVKEEQILTSGMLLQPLFAQRGWQGKRCMVLGPPDSHTYVREAGGEIVPIESEDDFDALVIGDEMGYPFLETMDRVLSLLFRQFDRGNEISLILPNPDLIYPSGEGQYGFASGTLASMFEQALTLRYGRTFVFTRLGKPYATIFEEAVSRIGTSNLLMVGDQLATDIRGARDFGLDAALVDTGISKHWEHVPPSRSPTWLLSSLAL